MAAQQILVTSKLLVVCPENHKLQTNIILSVAEEDVFQIRI